MTETVKSVLTDAFEDLVVGVDESPLTSSDARTGIRAMNRIMSTLASLGVNLGYTKVDSLDDEVTINDGAIDALISLLAFRLWPKYRSGEVSQTIASMARTASKTMFKLGVTIGATEYPSTLPTGSGNYYPGWGRYNTFYTDLESTILSEVNGSVSLEDSTEAT